MWYHWGIPLQLDIWGGFGPRGGFCRGQEAENNIREYQDGGMDEEDGPPFTGIPGGEKESHQDGTEEHWQAPDELDIGQDKMTVLAGDEGSTLERK